MTAPFGTRRRQSVTSSDALDQQHDQCMSGWLTATAWATCCRSVVLPAFAARRRAALPLPDRRRRGRRRAAQSLAPVSRRTTSSGEVAVRSAKCAGSPSLGGTAVDLEDLVEGGAAPPGRTRETLDLDPFLERRSRMCRAPPDVVGPRQVVGLLRAQEAVPLRQDSSTPCASSGSELPESGAPSATALAVRRPAARCPPFRPGGGAAGERLNPPFFSADALPDSCFTWPSCPGSRSRCRFMPAWAARPRTVGCVSAASRSSAACLSARAAARRARRPAGP